MCIDRCKRRDLVHHDGKAWSWMCQTAGHTASALGSRDRLISVGVRPTWSIQGVLDQQGPYTVSLS